MTVSVYLQFKLLWFVILDTYNKKLIKYSNHGMKIITDIYVD